MADDGEAPDRPAARRGPAIVLLALSAALLALGLWSVTRENTPPRDVATDTTTGRVWLLHLAAKPAWKEIETRRDSGDAPKAPDRALLPKKEPTPQQLARREAAKKKIVLPKDQPAPVPKLDALSYMLDPENSLTPELRAWAVGELAKYYPGEHERLLGALQSSDSLVVVAAIEAVDLEGDARYASAIEGLQEDPDPTIAAAARQKLEGGD